MTVVIPSEAACAAASTQAVIDGVVSRVRVELGDISHPFSIELVGDGERTHYRLEHRPVDLKSIIVRMVKVGKYVTPPAAPVYQPQVYNGTFVGDFSPDFGPTFDLHRVQIEGSGANISSVVPPVREWHASSVATSYYEDGEHFMRIGYGIGIDVDAGQVVFDSAPVAGSIIRVEGRKWRYFTDEDYARFAKTAESMIGYNRANSAGDAWSISDLKPIEEYPLVLLTTIQALWALATDAAFDIDILAPDGVNIPRSERYRQLMEMIGARQTQYDELAAALNIGVGRLETYTVRRVAKMTNRLVPVYLSREFDDWSKPKRVILGQNLLGTSPVDTMVGSMDIDLYSGYPWRMILDLGCNLTWQAEQRQRVQVEEVQEGPFGKAFSSEFEEDQIIVYEGEEVTTYNLFWRPEAHIRKNRGAPYGPPLKRMRCEILDAEKGIISLSLTTKDTRDLPYNAYWELQLRPDDGRTPLPVLAGMIRASITEVVL